jgi:hypothetical protein
MPAPLCSRICLVAAILIPRAGFSQSWEVEVRRVAVDHDPPSTVTETGEQVPAGWGVAGRYVARRGVFIELEQSGGSEQRLGAICGGFIFDPATQCIPEDVKYSGGLSGASVGYAGRIGLSPYWRIGIRPALGVGVIRAAEDGRETGRTYSEIRPALLASAAVEATFRFSDTGLGLIATVRAMGVQPIKASCLDCRQVFWRSISHVAYGLGVTWHR